ncbi:hypothetical protein GCM10010250_69400 [Streptomyces althioticus]|nr:hypothetical protein GCM10010250_69400 [Streptomyces althioticus]
MPRLRVCVPRRIGALSNALTTHSPKRGSTSVTTPPEPNRGDILELYKLAVEMADRVSTRQRGVAVHGWASS